MPDNEIKKLWESIETFAAYGFNKAHAASYGRIAYLTSYLKANYPVLYMAAVLTADSGDVDKISEMVEETKRMGIEVLPPDINESFADFTAIAKSIETDRPQIRFGLVTIKNFGEGIANTIIEERKKGGQFKSLEDFLQRVKSRNLNKKSLEALIKSGAMNTFGERGQLLGNLEEILMFCKEINRGSENQNSLFSSADISAPDLKLETVSPVSNEEKLAWEKELLGLYISGHPLDKFKDKLKKGSEIREVKEKLQSGMLCIIAGHVDEVKIIRTKKNQEMAFIKISDMSDNIETVLFPEAFKNYKDIVSPGSCIALKGRLSDRNGESSILVDKVKGL